MKKRCLPFGFVITVCLFILFETLGQSFPPVQQGFANYITISNGEFYDGNSIFRPLCINYLVDYACYRPNPLQKTYYIAPCFNYSDIGTSNSETEINDIIYDWHWCYGTNGQTEMVTAIVKLDSDLIKIKNLGFNVVRLRPAIYWKNDSLRVPTRSYAKYFELTDTLIAKCTRNNLRVTMVLSDDTNTYKQFDQYCVYLDSVTRHYSNNKTVMAYVVYMEPGYKWESDPEKDNYKLLISNWSRKWYYLIKKNAPHQLVSYGLDGINNVLFWDPSVLTYDFLTMHLYHNTSDPDSSKKAVECSFKWLHDNIEDVWVLGETGFSATVDSCQADPLVGTEAEQYQYADYTMEKSLECGCKGYSWWQYQDVQWKVCLHNYFGLVTYYPEERLKMLHSLFPTFSSRIPQDSCPRPSLYYNIPGYTCDNVHGIVTDNNANPIKDAYVVGWSDTYKTSYSTFTNSQGEYTIYTPEDTILSQVRISHKGYSQAKFFTQNATSYTSTLTHINYERWKKNWTNNNYPIASSIPVISATDTVVVGNFYGNEAQELLVVHFSFRSAALYTFHIDHWEQIWTGTIGEWEIHSIDHFSAGDFDGDGYDELLCFQNVSGALVSLFRFNAQNLSNPWQCFWTNAGDGKIGTLNYASGDIILSGHFKNSNQCDLMCIRNQGDQKNAVCQRLSSGTWSSFWNAITVSNKTYIGSWGIGTNDKFHVGDFNGDGIDELFCTQITNGESDTMALLKFHFYTPIISFWSTLWTNNGISAGDGLYPYKAYLHVGNFDADQADEFLGTYTWATKFDFNSSNYWDWSWSTYESKRLSDWSVNANHRIFFMKVMTDVPDYLLVSRGHPRINYKFDAYSYDPEL